MRRDTTVLRQCGRTQMEPASSVHQGGFGGAGWGGGSMVWGGFRGGGGGEVDLL